MKQGNTENQIPLTSVKMNASSDNSLETTSAAVSIPQNLKELNSKNRFGRGNSSAVLKKKRSVKTDKLVIKSKTKYIWLGLALLLIILLICGGITIYWVVTRYSCNFFGISTARSFFLVGALIVDENELKSLYFCKTLSKITLQGPSWTNVTILEDSFNSVTTFTFDSLYLIGVFF